MAMFVLHFSFGLNHASYLYQHILSSLFRMVQLSDETKSSLVARLISLEVWSDETACDAVAAYEKFFNLKIAADDFNSTKLLAPPAIDKVWRLHVLDTANYVRDCIKMCGKVISHSVDGVDRDEMMKRRNRTKRVYERLHGTFPEDSIWNFEENTVSKSTQTVIRKLQGESETAKDNKGAKSKEDTTKEVKVIEKDVTNRFYEYYVTVEASIGRTYFIHVSARTSIDDILEAISQESGFLCNPNWMLFGREDVIPYWNFVGTGIRLTVGCLSRRFGLDWFLDMNNFLDQRSQGNAWDSVIEMSLLTPAQRLPVYNVSVKTSCGEEYRMKITQQTKLKAIEKALDCDITKGKWKLATEPRQGWVASLTENFPPNTVMKATFIEWSGRKIETSVEMLRGRKHAISFHDDMLVDGLKRKIEQLEGIAPKDQLLLCKGKQLIDGTELSKYGISKEHPIRVVLKLPQNGPN